MNAILLTLLLAPALGVDNFVAGSGIGLSHREVRGRVRAGCIFAVFAVGMPLAGLLLGHDLAASIGQVGRFIGGGLLIGIGGYAVWTTRRRGDPGPARVPRTISHLLSAGFGTNVDSLVAGFALGVYAIPPFTAAVILGGVTATMSVVGLEVGVRLAALVEERSQQLGGIVLAGLGLVLSFEAFGL